MICYNIDYNPYAADFRCTTVPIKEASIMKHSKLLCVLALVLAMLCFFTACGKDEVSAQEYEARIAALQQENQMLRDQLAAAQGNPAPVSGSALSDWSLTAEATADRSGATITFSAAAAADQTMDLVITLNGLEAESRRCEVDGNRCTATVELMGADGYSYFCILTGSDGTQQTIPLYTTEYPGDGALVNLGSSLIAYCNLYIEQWEKQSDKLVIVSGFIQAQMPRIGTGDQVDATEAQLVFLHNGQEVDRQTLKLNVGEASGSYELALDNVSFQLPKLEDDHQLDLVLQVPLSNGSAISYNGCSWYYNAGELNPVMG